MAALACFARINAATTPPESVSTQLSTDMEHRSFRSAGLFNLKRQDGSFGRLSAIGTDSASRCEHEVFILAANAFLTPALLQRSASEHFPNGLANSSGLVGRNLMLHASAHVFVRPKRISRTLSLGMNYGLSLNDFYVHKGEKLGNLHAHPIVNRDQAVRFVVENSWGLDLLPGPLRYLVASKGTFLSCPWTAFAAIVEDLPYLENYVAAKAGSEEDIVYNYRYPPELRRRTRLMVDGFKAAVAALFDVRSLEPVGDLNGSHVCGTCRFGDDPRMSVLDRENRAHDLDNLYVLDASFFPSSGGINPQSHDCSQ